MKPYPLDALLRSVSRSFYLTVHSVPQAIRRQVKTAYLFCRAADTIADTRILPPGERLDLLKAYRSQFERYEPAGVERIAARLREGGRGGDGASAGGDRGAGGLPGERELLERLDECFGSYLELDVEDRRLIDRLVRTLTRGMETDLERFPPEESGEVEALERDEDLDLYCYHVAGCVGEFWTDLQCRHLGALRRWDLDEFRRRGVRFGKGLQMTNILRDVDSDLAIGRCYLPRERLRELEVDCRDLRDAGDRRVVRPLVHDLIRSTLELYRSGWEYTLAIPRTLFKLRLACTWPLWIGLRTLALLARAEDPCAPGALLKVSRPEVQRILRRSSLRSVSNRALDRAYRELEGEVERALEVRG